MPNSGEIPYAASSPPFILDSDMTGPLDSDSVFEFFDANQSLEGANSPGIFLGEDADNSQFVNFSTPAPFDFKSPVQSKATLETGVQHQLPSPSTASPTGSLPDSSSDSSGYKRKSSSESSRSVITPGDIIMADGGDWKMNDVMENTTGFGSFDGTINPASINSGGDFKADFNDKVMENDFDFESAASSPSQFGNSRVNSISPSMPTTKLDIQDRTPSAPRPRYDRTHLKANSVSATEYDFNSNTNCCSNIP